MFLSAFACTLVLTSACNDSAPSGTLPTVADAVTPRALPPAVEVSPEPQGIGLQDANFEPLSGAKADFGRLGGAVYQIEVPKEWNGRLVLYMHGFQGLAPKASVQPPGL